jgi:ADP-ribosylglycohydrolase
MIGAIVGDVIGSKYEFDSTKDYNFVLFKAGSTFTDDTVMSVATAEALMSGEPFQNAYRRFYSSYANRGYGGSFKKWASSGGGQPYNSWGNGSAMRVSPVGWMYDDEQKVLDMAKATAEVTHNHEEGIKGAQATAWCIWAARKGKTKIDIKEGVESKFGYNLNRKLDDIRPSYKFDVSCQGSVPESILCFLESSSFEDSIRLAVSMGGDADTMGCITGGMAEAFYGKVPERLAKEAFGRLDSRLKIVVAKFIREHVNKDFDLDEHKTETKEDLTSLMGTIFSK